jgi:hypothetical protein
VFARGGGQPGQDVGLVVGGLGELVVSDVQAAVVLQEELERGGERRKTHRVDFGEGTVRIRVAVEGVVVVVLTFLLGVVAEALVEVVRVAVGTCKIARQKSSPGAVGINWSRWPKKDTLRNRLQPRYISICASLDAIVAVLSQIL